MRVLVLWRLHWHTHLEADSILLSQMCKDWGKDLGEMEGKRRRGWPRKRWLDELSESVEVSLSRLRETVKDREAWCGAVRGVAKSQPRRSNWAAARHVKTLRRNSSKVLWQPSVSWGHPVWYLCETNLNPLTHAPCDAPHLAQNTMRFISSLNVSLLCSTPNHKRASLVAQTVKNLPAMQGTQVWALVG